MNVQAVPVNCRRSGPSPGTRRTRGGRRSEQVLAAELPRTFALIDPGKSRGRHAPTLRTGRLLAADLNRCPGRRRRRVGPRRRTDAEEPTRPRLHCRGRGTDQLSPGMAPLRGNRHARGSRPSRTRHVRSPRCRTPHPPHQREPDGPPGRLGRGVEPQGVGSRHHVDNNPGRGGGAEPRGFSEIDTSHSSVTPSTTRADRPENTAPTSSLTSRTRWQRRPSPFATTEYVTEPNVSRSRPRYSREGACGAVLVDPRLAGPSVARPGRRGRQARAEDPAAPLRRLPRASVFDADARG